MVDCSRDIDEKRGKSLMFPFCFMLCTHTVLLLLALLNVLCWPCGDLFWVFAFEWPFYFGAIVVKHLGNVMFTNRGIFQGGLKSNL